jgi:hypothetical protein
MLNIRPTLMAARPGLANAIAANRAPTIQRKGYFDMFHIGQRVVCIDDRFPGENGVFDPTFAERCPNLPVRGLIYTVRDFVVPYAGYPGTQGMLLEEIINPPCPYFEGTFEPSFFPSHFRPVNERATDISIFTSALRLPKYARDAGTAEGLAGTCPSRRTSSRWALRPAQHVD